MGDWDYTECLLYSFLPPTIRNPVISRNDVSDARAQFVADPFMVCQDGRWYLFFEVMNQDSDRGEIGLALSDDGIIGCTVGSSS